MIRGPLLVGACVLALHGLSLYLHGHSGRLPSHRPADEGTRTQGDKVSCSKSRSQQRWSRDLDPGSLTPEPFVFNYVVVVAEVRAHQYKKRSEICRDRELEPQE